MNPHSNGAVDPIGLVESLRQRQVKRVKLAVVDIDGVLRGKYLNFDKFTKVVKGGASFCDCIFGWDTNDQLYDNATFSGWHKGFPDVNFRLDLSTLRWLPHEENIPFFLGELIPNQGETFHPICPRNVLKNVLQQTEDRGFNVRMAFEYEFFVFNETPQSVRDKGFRNLQPFSPGMFGYSVLRISTHAELHNAFMDFCAGLGLEIEGFHTETGPGVFEACMTPAEGIEAADKAVLFKTFAKVFFQRQDLMATFMAKWSPHYPGQSGHFHHSLWQTKSGKSAFYESGQPHNMSEIMRHFVAGQVQAMPELTAMIAPTVNSYSRMVKGAWAPTTATWSVDNRTTALRVIEGGENSERVEYRLAAADGNPYLVAAAAILSGMEGVDRHLTLGPKITGNAYAVQDSLPPEHTLPATLREATARFSKSQIARKWLGDVFVGHYCASRDWETREFERAITDWELQRYLEII